MNEEQLQQQNQELAHQLVATKSKAFDSISKLMEERENAIKGIGEMENALNQIVGLLDLGDSPTISKAVERINELVTYEKRAKNKVAKPKLAEKK
jgi:hypothetical protein